VLAFTLVLMLGVHLVVSALAWAISMDMPLVSGAPNSLGASRPLRLRALGLAASELAAGAAHGSARPLRRQTVERIPADGRRDFGCWRRASSPASWRPRGASSPIAAARCRSSVASALHLGLRPVVTAARARAPRRLLLLRRIWLGRRSRRLLDSSEHAGG